MTKEYQGADPVNVGDHGLYSERAKEWLAQEGSADPERVAAYVRALVKNDAHDPYRPERVSRVARGAVVLDDFNLFIAVVKFARLRHLVAV